MRKTGARRRRDSPPYPKTCERMTFTLHWSGLRFPVASRTFPSRKVARKRAPPQRSPQGGARFCASAKEKVKGQWGLSGEYLVFCMVGLAGRGRPPGGPSWAILSLGPPGGRALPGGAPDKKSQGFHPFPPCFAPQALPSRKNRHAPLPPAPCPLPPWASMGTGAVFRFQRADGAYSTGLAARQGGRKGLIA